MTGLNPTDTWETQSRPNGEKKNKQTESQNWISKDGKLRMK